ncbi:MULTISPECIES: outer membrane protein assembly factor BamE [unclassified Thalassospira]|jgi:outer membrane protein assembly factor BamE (lipoprotein component of BamABCDE complex)|uniref:outer membrane protein assembly factor BamE n=1 Tax=unclassified Thalassospira TaxID=2648997 RepID=UPI000A1EEC60|nr:outer membrane protein assembly factor BamE [Thalassospira sp. MCCC 1A01428]OSQ42322.1 membrane protein SmpA [Thalassospira sp. MCCC 1A01428]
MHSRIKRFTFIVITGFTAAWLAACSPQIANRGNLPEPEDLDQIKIGQSTKGDVTDLLGTPSSIATFDPNVWLYISRQVETLAFFKPDVTKQEVVVISFDTANRVDLVKQYHLEDGKPVEPTDRVTPTAGRELTILQQLFGNLGRFTDTEK